MSVNKWATSGEKQDEEKCGQFEELPGQDEQCCSVLCPVFGVVLFYSLLKKIRLRKLVQNARCVKHFIRILNESDLFSC